MNVLQFQVVLTEKCNLACAYCYMKNRPKDMTREVFDAHYDFLPSIMEKYNKNGYKLAIFGGEPLMNWDLLKYVVEKTTDRVNGIVITNGLALGPDRQEFLKDNNMGLSISFDGLWNKSSRCFPDGRSSFDQYMAMKSILRIKGCKVMISPDRCTTLKENYLWFLNEFGVTSPDFTLVRDDIWSEEDIEKYEIELEELADEVIKNIKNGINTLPGPFNLYILDTYMGRTYGKRKFGCFSGHNGFGFMTDGLVYACARFGSEKLLPIANSVEKIYYDDNKELFLKPEVVDPNIYCPKDCVIFPYCNAGCTYSQLDNDECKPVESICKLLKASYIQTYRINKVLRKNEKYQQIIKSLLGRIGDG